MKKYKVVFVLIVILLMGVGYFFLKESQQENFTYTYTDKTYNYKITFPSSWKDIKVISDIGQNQSFALPTIDVNWLEDIGSGQKVKGYGAVFFLRRITLSEWDNMRKACGEKIAKPGNLGVLLIQTT